VTAATLIADSHPQRTMVPAEIIPVYARTASNLKCTSSVCIKGAQGTNVAQGRNRCAGTYLRIGNQGHFTDRKARMNIKEKVASPTKSTRVYLWMCAAILRHRIRTEYLQYSVLAPRLVHIKFVANAQIFSDIGRFSSNLLGQVLRERPDNKSTSASCQFARPSAPDSCGQSHHYQ
jgi:hypothetical protein